LELYGLGSDKKAYPVGQEGARSIRGILFVIQPQFFQQSNEQTPARQTIITIFSANRNGMLVNIIERAAGEYIRHTI
jgi:hypothetical protein